MDEKLGYEVGLGTSIFPRYRTPGETDSHGLSNTPKLAERKFANLFSECQVGIDLIWRHFR